MASEFLPAQSISLQSTASLLTVLSHFKMSAALPDAESAVQDFANGSTSIVALFKLYRLTKRNMPTACLHRGRRHLALCMCTVDANGEDITPVDVLKFTQEHDELQEIGDNIERTIELPLKLSIDCLKKKIVVVGKSKRFEARSEKLEVRIQRTSAMSISKRLQEQRRNASGTSEDTQSDPRASTPILVQPHDEADDDVDIYVLDEPNISDLPTVSGIHVIVVDVDEQSSVFGHNAWMDHTHDGSHDYDPPV